MFLLRAKSEIGAPNEKPSINSMFYAHLYMLFPLLEKGKKISAFPLISYYYYKSRDLNGLRVLYEKTKKIIQSKDKINPEKATTEIMKVYYRYSKVLIENNYYIKGQKVSQILQECSFKNKSLSDENAQLIFEVLHTTYSAINEIRRKIGEKTKTFMNIINQIAEENKTQNFQFDDKTNYFAVPRSALECYLNQDSFKTGQSNRDFNYDLKYKKDFWNVEKEITYNIIKSKSSVYIDEDMKTCLEGYFNKINCINISTEFLMFDTDNIGECKLLIFCEGMKQRLDLLFPKRFKLDLLGSLDELKNETTRETALAELSRKRETFADLAIYIWYSTGTVSAL